MYPSHISVSIPNYKYSYEYTYQKKFLRLYNYSYVGKYTQVEIQV